MYQVFLAWSKFWTLRNMVPRSPDSTPSSLVESQVNPAVSTEATTPEAPFRRSWRQKSRP
jgi:hypothetical protein